MDKGFTLSPTQVVSLLSTHTLLSTSTLLSTHTLLSTCNACPFVIYLPPHVSIFTMDLEDAQEPNYAFMRALFEIVGQEVGKFEAVDVRLGATNAQLGEQIEGVKSAIGPGRGEVRTS